MTDKTWTRDGEPLAYGPFVSDGVEHPAAALDLWGDEELAAFGIVRTIVEDAGPSLEQCLAELADYRWRQTLVMPEYDGAVQVPAETARSVVTSKVLESSFMTEEQKLERHAFKLKTGEWRDWNVYDLIAYGVAIGGHIQLCFDREAVLEADIISAYPEPVDITVGWPE